MADDDREGTVLGFPARLQVPGAVGDDTPPTPGGFPTLPPLTELTPPASLSVPQGPDLSRAFTTSRQEPEAEPEFDTRSGVAAMSTVMMAGIAVAALRGAYHVALYLKARHEHHQAIADQQRAVAGKSRLELDKARIQADGFRQRARMQSGPEYGRHARQHGGYGGRQHGRGGQVPATFRSGAAPRPPASRTPSTPHRPTPGPAGGRTGAGGGAGRPNISQARRKALEQSAAGLRTGRTPGVGAAVRDRVAHRVANGPPPRPVRPDRGSGVRAALRRRAADRITTGSWKPPGAPADAGAKSRPVSLVKSPASPQSIRGALRARVADRITHGAWNPHPRGPKSSVPREQTIRGALRGRAVDRITHGKKPQAPASPGTGPTVDLTKKPKAPKVDLTKKPKAPKATAPKVDLTKKPKTRRTGARGPRAGRRRRMQDRWQRAGARRSQRAAGPGRTSPGPSGTPGAASGPGGGAGSGGAFGPPPGWGYRQGPTITVERADGGPRPDSYYRQQQRPGSTPAALGAAASGAARRRTGAGSVRPGSPNTQYADADLTIYDVIEADGDMAEEITQGADDARAAAEGCESLMDRLEALHAKIQDLKVPGVLEGLVLLLFEKAGSVKARALAVAETIPAAAEAIGQARVSAEERHRPLADAVRDAGHTAPAEADYHNE